MLKIKNFFSYFFFAFFFVFALFSAVPVLAAVPPTFSLEAPQAQGAGSDEFYVGRCFRVNIYLNTGGINSNGADVELNYDNSVSQIVQNDCTTPVTKISTGSIYNNYPAVGNDVSATKIILSGYNNPGVSTNLDHGLYGYFYVRITGATNNYPLTFAFTPDLTTDTNMAETGGDGSDALNSVENLTLKFVTDNDDPTITNMSPADGAVGVNIGSNVTFYANDAMSGVNSALTAVRMKKGAGAYVAQSVSSGSVQTTNANRNYRYTTTINSNVQMKTNGGYYAYNTTYTVEATVTDVATAPHSAVEVWSFTTENDVAAPYVTNKSPAADAVGVSANSNIIFRVKDYKNNDGSTPGMGVDTATISVNVATSTGSIDYTCASPMVTCDNSDPNSVLVTIDPTNNFGQNEVVTVTIHASDLASPVNVMNAVSYSFSTEDTLAPIIANFTPTPNSNGNSSSTNIAFNIIDTGAGVAIETLQVYVNNTLYTAASPELSFVGDASDYRITINPLENFSENIPVSVRISFRDQAPSQNYVSPNPTVYNFIIGLNTDSGEDCPVCASCPQVTCPGGNGGGTVYIEKQCPVYSEKVCPVCETLPQKVEGQKCETKERIQYIYVTTTVREVITQNGNGIANGTGNGSPLGGQPNIPPALVFSEEVPSHLVVSTTHAQLSAVDFEKMQTATKKRNTILFVIIAITSFVGMLLVNTLFRRNTVLFATLALSVVGIILMNTDLTFFVKLFHLKGSLSPENSFVLNQNGQEKIFGERVKIPKFRGTLVDAVTQKPLSHVMVSSETQVTQTDDAGLFILKDVYSNERISVAFKDSSASALLAIGKLPERTYFIDRQISEVIRTIEPLYAQRKFKSVYRLAAAEYRNKKTEQDFVSEKNKAILEQVTEYRVVDTYFDYETSLLKTWNSTKLNKTFNNVLTVHFVTVRLDGKNTVSETKETWHFIEEGGAWKFVE